MKRTLFFMACVLASLTISAQDDLTVGDIQNSGCLRMARGEESEPLPTIILTKEGSVLSVQLLNYESNCGTTGFEVTPTVNNAYLVRITDETGKAVYEKAVNAGSIVGLNIDISDYAEGRYTVTVENNDESFTGQFDAQTTSFVEVRSKRLEVKDGIYNLQG